MLSDSKQVGKKIKEYRLKLGMTQKELAYHIDKTWEMVSRYERGLSSAHREIDDIAKALGVTTSKLVDSEHDSLVSMFPRVPYYPNRARYRETYQETNTNVYYNCPDWVLHKDKEVFAVPSSAVNASAKDLRAKKGVYFIAPNVPCSIGDLTLYFNQKTREPQILRLNFIPKDKETLQIMGRVLAFEQYFE